MPLIQLYVHMNLILCPLDSQSVLEIEFPNSGIFLIVSYFETYEYQNSSVFGNDFHLDTSLTLLIPTSSFPTHTSCPHSQQVHSRILEKELKIKLS